MFQTTNQFPLANHQPSTSVNPTKKVFFSLLLTAPPFLLSLPFFLGWQCGPPTGRLGVSLPRCDGFLLGFQLASELLWYKYTDYKEHHRTWQKWIPWHLFKDSDILWYRSHLLGIPRKIRSSAAQAEKFIAFAAYDSRKSCWQRSWWHSEYLHVHATTDFAWSDTQRNESNIGSATRVLDWERRKPFGTSSSQTDVAGVVHWEMGLLRPEACLFHHRTCWLGLPDDNWLFNAVTRYCGTSLMFYLDPPNTHELWIKLVCYPIIF